MLTPQFFGMTEGGVDLQSIKPVGENIDTEGGLYIQELDYAGRDIASYQWIDWGDPTGWCDGDYTLVEGKKFAEGTGLWITGEVGNNIQTSGQVGQEEVTIALRHGATGTGNPYPVEIDLQDLYLTADEGVTIDTEGGIYIQELDYAGRDIASYQWIDWGDPTGWCDGDYTLVEGKKFAPGAGLWVTAEDGIYINFPSPEL